MESCDELGLTASTFSESMLIGTDDTIRLEVAHDAAVHDTVNSEIFTRVLFSRNFEYAKFRENKILTKWRNHSFVYWYR